MQYGRRGLRPTRTRCIRDEVGNRCTSQADQHQQWQRHFTEVLNVRSKFEGEESPKIRQHLVRQELNEISELTNALKKLKNGKAGGSSGILPEMVKVGGCRRECLEMLLGLIHTVWEEQHVSRDWTDAILIPIPKKGGLSRCNNWRGISLLDVVGKAMGKILQERLAKDVLPESQCGLRKGHGCWA